VQALVQDFRLPEPVYVTRPNLPPLTEYLPYLEQIWQSRWLTNAGAVHQEFEQRLGAYLKEDHLSVFCNGTLALLVALQALRLNSGEVITTPFTFPATPHVLYWNRIQPVFCDIDPETFCIDPVRIEQLIGPDTKAILGVHVYGTPCDVEAIQAIADRHGLHVLYDAAHAFGARYKGRQLSGYGDISMLSFHATKLFSTFEGGALVMQNAAQQERVNFLKNFGIANEETVIGPGINGKMNELQAAYGLLQLDMVDAEIANRKQRAQWYDSHLRELPGLTLLDEMPGLDRNYAYYPVLVDPDRFGMTRDDIFDALRAANIFSRKYFFPLCSHYACYAALPSSRPEHLPVAERVASQVLCLPMYGNLEEETVHHIGRFIARLAAT
jgi:dTDP-4-amino-4,6-dideoxygalactose transaminase